MRMGNSSERKLTDSKGDRSEESGIRREVTVILSLSLPAVTPKSRSKVNAWQTLSSLISFTKR